MQKDITTNDNERFDNMGISGYLFIALVIAYIAYIKYLGYRSPEQIKEMTEAVRKGAVLVDVRTAAEFNAGHIAGAINVPLSNLSQSQRDIGSLEKTVVLYCRSGSRSRSARGILERMGFKKILDLGPMNNWPS